MDEETWKKGGELVEKMPELKTVVRVEWREKGAGDNFMLLCALLKGNAIPTKRLDFNCDGKKKKRKRNNKIMKKRKECGMK